MTESDDERTQMVTGLRALLRITACKRLADVACYIDDAMALDDESAVYGVGPFAREGIIVRVGARGTQLEYPFPMGELWDTVAELEMERDLANGCEWLALEIGGIDGIDVLVNLDYYCDPALTRPESNRRTLESGLVLQDVPSYPFETPMAGTATFAEWKATRFDPLYTGLELLLRRPEGTVRSDAVTLAALRAEWA